MAAWGVVNDLETVLEGMEGLDMSPEASDKIANLLIGLKELYEIRFNELFSTFEDFVRAYYAAQQASNYPKVDRVEVIDGQGRSYSKWNIRQTTLSLQDNGRTLKVFVEEY